MSGWFTYLLQSAISLILLYGIYALFMKKDTFFTMNRVYLASSLVFSAILPLIDFSFLFAGNGTVRYYVVLDTISITPGEVSSVVTSNISVFQVILVAYLTGVAIFAVRFAVQFGQLTWLVRKYGITQEEGIRLVLIHREYSPFSFFNLIFINAKDYNPEQLREIIEHERVHIRQYHTVDIIVLEIMTIFQWFNPVIWFYRRSLKGLHEYLADEGVLLKGFNIKKYQNMLLNQAMGIQLNDLTNNFNKSLLKRRLIMMNTPRSGLAARLKPLLALPLVIVMVLAFSFTGGFNAMAQDTPPPPPVKEKQLPPSPPKLAKSDKAVKKAVVDGKEEMVYKEVAQKPEFKGGQAAFISYLVENVKYPEEAKKKEITGKVYVQFIVDKKGRINSPEVIKSADPLLDAEAVRAISSMPDWIPGKDENGKPVNVSMTIPIVFQLDADEKEKKKE
jgi:TonB family protein